MKKLIVVIFIAFFLLNTSLYAVSKMITIKEQKLGNLKLYMTYDQILKVMKVKPITIESNKGKQMEGEPLSETVKFKDGTEVYIMDGETFSITVKSLNYPTPRGLKVGDSISRLKQLYGEPNYIQDGIWTYSYDHGDYDAMYIKFKKQKISELTITLTM